MGSSADTAHVVAQSDFPTLGWESGKSRSRSLNLSQVRRLRWLRRHSHLYQARRTWCATCPTAVVLPRTLK